jgi:hypothetical protein
VPVALCANATPTPLASAQLSDFVKNGLVGLIVGVGIAGSALAVLAVVVGRQCWRGRRGASNGMDDVVEMEMGYMQENEKKTKGYHVRVVEKSRDESWGEDEQAMYFAPPPRRATGLVEKRERKMGLKGILKVKIPSDGMR